MGTRGALGFRFLDEDKVTYNHFDSYPSGLGVDVIRFISSYNDEQLAGTAKRIELVKEDISPTPEQIARYSQFHDSSVSTGKPTEWYSLLRGSQGDLTGYVTGDLDHMIDSHGFLSDSLFCEWAYIINMDNRTLEVYKGFNQDENAPGRYANAYQDEYNKERGYCGVALIDEVPLDDIRKMSGSEAVELLAKWERREDDDE